jgi:CBS domain containing-hemolysin-like protein
MTVFILSVVVVLVVSAVCSLTEAALYSVRLPYIRRLADSGTTSGAVLLKLKQNMGRPIAAILILNTAANTAGAAVAGAQANHLFGERVLLVFSVLFTLSVLFFSEIIPKMVGVLHSRPVARHAAVPLNALVTVLHPIISMVERVSKWLKPKGRLIAAPEEEVRQFAMLSAEEGSIMQLEAELVKNALALDKVTAREIMTPRTVVEKLSDATTVRDAAREVGKAVYSRIPIFDDEDPETWVGVVLTRDVLAAYARNELDVTLSSLARPIDFIPEQTPGHVLLRKFIKTRRHLFAVANEYGGVVGVVTLEDILESVIGQEIMDEVDVTEDLQELAKHRRKRQIQEAEAGHEAAPASEQESEPRDRS